MSIKCLAVDSDFDVASTYVTEWANHGVKMDCAVNMTEAIQMLQLNEYIFVGINGDAVDFMPLLSTMRSVTNIPIMIATSNFTTEKEVAAIGSGADLFSRWHNSPKDNIASVLAHIARKTTRTDEPKNVLIYGSLLVSPSQRKVFVGNESLELTRQEFDLLHYLMDNEGRVLSFEQIYRTVWNDEYDESAYEPIKAVIKRLRKKLGEIHGNQRIIQNRWGIGYTLPPIIE